MSVPRAGLIALAVVLGACGPHPAAQAPALLTPIPLFGPVIGAEIIGGRADAGEEILLLAGGTDLLRISPALRRAIRVKLRVPIGTECWNLARLEDGSVWTLIGRRTLAQLAMDGAIVSETTLSEPHFGLFSAGGRLVFQRAEFTAPGPALVAGVAADPSRRPWSGIVTRSFPSLARASVAALNMATCGATDSLERACWFPDEAAVSFVTEDGATRRVVLQGLEVVSPEILLTSDNPRRPVRDAYVDAGGSVWVLSSGSPTDARMEVAGGWVLAHYDSQGRPMGLARLPEAARLILRVDARHVLLLMSTGMVGQVTRW